MTLMDVRPGVSCVIKNIFVNNLRKRIIDMGLTTGTKVTVKKLAPLGDPMEIQVRGYLLTIRKAEARMIDVELSHEEADQ
ncbi:MAG: FeoA family protein [Candidatus Izemoplasmatales bacterium]|nr:FeoA family protein [Candidatus Izemoplasmatales bacterium]NLF48918.1 ferrous iron transport protein A [Acholeplasmataceae bacterium]MDD4354738.1 FeoA family protein [Candidatus Izemoplasmatales bacterium]MDD4988055.1 FeoA family protein [Candidatus Izemoplasmatales bacterium]MDD5601702.1 FeoA family protein [Candidatus Izemoplasmatales bacterium]